MHPVADKETGLPRHAQEHKKKVRKPQCQSQGSYSCITRLQRKQEFADLNKSRRKPAHNRNAPALHEHLLRQAWGLALAVKTEGRALLQGLPKVKRCS